MEISLGMAVSTSLMKTPFTNKVFKSIQKRKMRRNNS